MQRQGKNKKLTHVLLSYLKCWSSSYQDPASSCKLTPHEQNYLSFDILYLGGMNIIMMRHEYYCDVNLFYFIIMLKHFP